MLSKVSLRSNQCRGIRLKIKLPPSPYQETQLRPPLTSHMGYSIPPPALQNPEVRFRSWGLRLQNFSPGRAGKIRSTSRDKLDSGQRCRHLPADTRAYAASVACPKPYLKTQTEPAQLARNAKRVCCRLRQLSTLGDKGVSILPLSAKAVATTLVRHSLCLPQDDCEREVFSRRCKN